MVYFSHTAYVISPRGFSKIKALTIRIYVSDCTGTVFFTDMLLQGGSIATGWTPHVSEIKWALDG